MKDKHSDNPAAIRQTVRLGSASLWLGLASVCGMLPAFLVFSQGGARTTGELVVGVPALLVWGAGSLTGLAFAIAATAKALRRRVRLGEWGHAIVGALWCAGSLFLFAAFVLPLALPHTESRAQRASDRWNLMITSTIIAIYRDDHEGQCPPDLAALADEGYIDLEMLQPVSLPGVFYPYVGRIPPDVPADTILCYTPKGLKPGGRYVLLANTKVSWSTEEALADPSGTDPLSLRCSYDSVVAAFGDGLTPERDAELRRFYEVIEP